jgi:hypothetical protein
MDGKIAGADVESNLSYISRIVNKVLLPEQKPEKPCLCVPNCNG